MDPDAVSSPDRALIDAIRHGDETAFRTMFDTWYDALSRFARHHVAVSADIDEIIADVFLNVWVNRQGWNPGGGVAPYLFRAVRNRARNTVRDTHTAQRNLAQHHHDTAAPG